MPASVVVRLISLHAMPQMPIWTRLGFRERTASPDIQPQYQALIGQFVRETQVRVFYIEKNLKIENNVIQINEHRFRSQLVEKRCLGAERVFLLGASARAEDMQRLEEFQQSQNMEQAVILDAVLSEKVDYALDFVEKELTVELRRSGLVFGPRLSCGYGDFSLENQGYFFQALDFAQHGIRLSPQNILIPEKTVTALAPVFRR